MACTLLHIKYPIPDPGLSDTSSLPTPTPPAALQRLAARHFCVALPRAPPLHWPVGGPQPLHGDLWGHGAPNRDGVDETHGKQHGAGVHARCGRALHGAWRRYGTLVVWHQVGLALRQSRACPVGHSCEWQWPRGAQPLQPGCRQSCWP